MKKLALSVLFVVLFSGIAEAGGVRGLVKVRTKGVSRVTIRILDHGKLLDSCITDIKGAYRMYIKKSGRFSIQAVYKSKTTNKIPIRVFRKTLNFNLILSANKTGFTLRRE